MTTLASDLHELCDIEIGRTPARANRHYWNNGTQQWLSISDFSHGDEVNKTKECVTEKAVRDCNLKVHPKGTLVMSFKLTIGKLAFLGAPMATNEAIVALKPRDGGTIDPRFLYHFLSQYNFDHLLDRAVKGRTLNKEKLRGIRVTYPKDLEEQRRIAAILDKADAIRRKREQALGLCDNFLRSVFLEMFGDPQKNPQKWPLVEVAELGDVQGGLQVSHRRDGYELRKPYLRVANVFRDRLDLREVKEIGLTHAEFERTQLKAGDVLIVEGHGNPDEIGRASVWDGSIEHCVHQNHLIRFRSDPTKVKPEFFCRLMNTEGGRLQLVSAGRTTSGLSTISTRKVKEATIPLPPIEMQAQFDDFVVRTSLYKTGLTKAWLEADSICASISQRAFRGELLEAA